MKKIELFVCEFCGKKSKNSREIYECEASHIGNGLTADEYETYQSLKYLYGYTKEKYENMKDEESRESLINVTNRLKVFKREHGIS